VRIIDITLPLRQDLAVWPGDVPVSLHQALSIKGGDSVNLGSIEMSLHAGTHMDSPYHFCDDATTAEGLDLSVCFGPALVIDVSGKSIITCGDLREVEVHRVERLLLKTNGWLDHSRFPEQIPTIAPDVPEFLNRYGIVLLGVDVPSVDSIESKSLPNHKSLYEFGITILESLLLDKVEEGIYLLAALPLRIEGVDGAPVRATLQILD